MIYAKALADIRKKLDKFKIILHIYRRCHGAPWPPHEHANHIMNTPIVDITFVDDEAMIVTATSSTRLKLNLAQ
eukprot:5900126-Karenia_brevis.AAC.1